MIKRIKPNKSELKFLKLAYTRFYDLYEIKIPTNINEHEYDIEIEWDIEETYCDPVVAYKPVLYLYPEQKTNITVNFSNEENLTTTYPKFKEQWEVTAYPNGDLYDSNNNYYYALYWEEKTYKELEIILVDDGSPDNCPQMCDEWAKKDKRIKVIHKENGGVSSARNDGIKKSTGEYITFVDSDDWIDLDYFEKLYNSAKKYNSTKLLCNLSLSNSYFFLSKIISF